MSNILPNVKLLLFFFFCFPLRKNNHEKEIEWKKARMWHCTVEIELNWKTRGLILKVNRRQRWKEFNTFPSLCVCVCFAEGICHVDIFFLISSVVVVVVAFSVYIPLSLRSHFRAYIELSGCRHMYDSCDNNLLVSRNQDRIGYR